MKLTPEKSQKLMDVLKERFEKNIVRHKGLGWDAVQERLKTNPEKLWSLSEMERTGGEPDLVGQDNKTDEYLFYDCSIESPKGRRSLCYDREALNARKDNKPENSVIDMANEMGIELLNEEEYRYLQSHGRFDTKTSSWIKTPHLDELQRYADPSVPPLVPA